MFSLESVGPHQLQELEKLEYPPTDLFCCEAMSDWYGKVGMKARTSGKEKAGLQIAGEPGLTTIHRGTGLRTPTTSFGIVSR